MQKKNVGDMKECNSRIEFVRFWSQIFFPLLCWSSYIIIWHGKSADHLLQAVLFIWIDSQKSWVVWKSMTWDLKNKKLRIFGLWNGTEERSTLFFVWMNLHLRLIILSQIRILKAVVEIQFMPSWFRPYHWFVQNSLRKVKKKEISYLF